jgi:hypothetical protein
MVLYKTPEIGEVIKYPTDIDISLSGTTYHIPANTPGTIVEIWEHPIRNDIWLVQIEFKIMVSYPIGDDIWEDEEFVSIYTPYQNVTITEINNKGFQLHMFGSNIAPVDINYYAQGYQSFMQEHAKDFL